MRGLAAAVEALLRLLARLGREDAERHGDPRLDRRQLETARRLARDEIEVRRLPRMMHPSATTHEKRRVFASASAVNGSSNAPGTGTTVMASSWTLQSRSAASALSSRPVVMSPLKRLTTTATLRRNPCGPPSRTSTPGGMASAPGRARPLRGHGGASLVLLDSYDLRLRTELSSRPVGSAPPPPARLDRLGLARGLSSGSGSGSGSSEGGLFVRGSAPVARVGPRRPIRLERRVLGEAVRIGLAFLLLGRDRRALRPRRGVAERPVAGVLERV